MSKNVLKPRINASLTSEQLKGILKGQTHLAESRVKEIEIFVSLKRD